MSASELKLGTAGKKSVYDIKTGEFFLGITGKVHLRTPSGSVRLDDAQVWTTESLFGWGTYDVLPTGSSIVVTSI